jgi:hypothetical protein
VIKKSIGSYNLLVHPPPMSLFKHASYLKDKEWLKDLVAPAYMNEDDKRREWFYLSLYKNEKPVDMLLDPDFSSIFSGDDDVCKKQNEYNAHLINRKQIPWAVAFCLMLHKDAIAKIEQRCGELK